VSRVQAHRRNNCMPPQATRRALRLRLRARRAASGLPGAGLRPACRHGIREAGSGGPAALEPHRRLPPPENDRKAPKAGSTFRCRPSFLQRPQSGPGGRRSHRLLCSTVRTDVARQRWQKGSQPLKKAAWPPPLVLICRTCTGRRRRRRGKKVLSQVFCVLAHSITQGRIDHKPQKRQGVLVPRRTRIAEGPHVSAPMSMNCSATPTTAPGTLRTAIIYSRRVP